jgi:endonuclease YncB( thermonuclease family)
MPAKINPEEYNRLFNDICILYDQMHLQSAYKNKRTLKTYWQIGRRILNTVNTASQGGSYGKKIIQTLSADLTRKYGDGFGKRTVDYFRNFATVYKVTDLNADLNWSHYRALMSITDNDTRTSFEQRAISEKLTKDQLIQLIAYHRRPTGADSQSFPLTPRIASPGNYKIISPPRQKHGEFVIDLGFNVQFAADLPGVNAGAGAFVRRQDSASYATVDIQPGERYCYPGKIVDVIDGDTVKMQLNLGFRISIIESMRLRGVDAMERDTPEGQKAKRALQRLLNRATTVHAFTYHHDRYGRYITDLIVDEHIYINKKLVEQGHARFLKM